MNLPALKGLSYGLTSGVITTLGLIVGLHSSTNSELAVVGGIIVIAVADALSDALGIHISEESSSQLTPREVWESTIYTFIAKFVVAGTFLIPILLLAFNTAIIISIAWGLSLIIVLSVFITNKEHASVWHTITEHLLIAVAVIVITHYLGDWVASTFNAA